MFCYNYKHLKPIIVKKQKKKVLAARWLPCMSFSFSQVGQKKSEEVSLFCTSSFAISAIRRSKNEKFFAKKRESWSFYCCCHATNCQLQLQHNRSPIEERRATTASKTRWMRKGQWRGKTLKADHVRRISINFPKLK